MNDRAYIDVELPPELAERLRLFCEIAGNLSRDEILTAALEQYGAMPEPGGEVVPIGAGRSFGRRRDGEPR
jgi:hypothetical protein